MLKQKVIDIPIYPGRLELIVATSPAEVRRYVEDYNREEVGYHTFQHSREIHPEFPGQKTLLFSIILTPRFEPPHGALTYGKITHECLHATNMILDYAHVGASFDNDEAAAYLITWVADYIFSTLKEWNIKIHTI